jgi:hypothetical protein
MTTQAIPKWPTPWPLRLLGWLFGLFALLVVAAFLAIGATGAYYELTRTTDGDVEALIESDLPERATTEQILRFLEANAMVHEGVRASTADDTRLVEAGVAPGTMTITGTLLNDGYALQLRDVEVKFILDAERKLQGYLVYEVAR